MRILATVAFSFAAGIFAAVLIPGTVWPLYAAAGIFLLTVFGAFFRGGQYRKAALLVGLSLVAALGYDRLYHAVCVAPIEEQYGKEIAFTAVVYQWPVETDYGAMVTVKLTDYPNRKAVYYGDDTLMALRPGNVLHGNAKWQNAGLIDGETVTQFMAKGIYVLLYDRGELSVEQGYPDALRWLPQRAAHTLQNSVRSIWKNSSVSGFLLAELTGDKSGVVDEDYIALQETGLAHLFAVSGLHCAFMVTLVQLLFPKHRRRIVCVITVAVLLFYALMTGLSPSVVRACVMQIFLLTAPLFRRNSDGLTSLGGALLLILLANPNAAASVSLQLSFSAMLGVLLVSGRLYQWITEKYHGKNIWGRRAIAFVAANLSASAGALLFTTPLVAYYFRILSLVAPLTGLLTLWAGGWSFMAGFVSAVSGVLWLPMGRVLSFFATVTVHYVLAIAHAFTRVPYHAVYFNNAYLQYWLIYVYMVFGVCALQRRARRRRYFMAAVLAVVTLGVTLWFHAQTYRYGAMTVEMLDVGQGQSMVLASGRSAALVDCGSSNREMEAGSIASVELASMGFHRLNALVVTHYHADHTNGLYELISRVPIDTFYLPDIEDEYGVRDRLVALAAQYGAAVVWVHDEETMEIGEADLTVFPPLGQGDLNEQGLSVLCSAGDFDVLITGDMGGDTEYALAESYDLPDIEVLAVSHHGSKYSSDADFLACVTPDTALISVGENDYGHPTPEALWRLTAAGCATYRTDEAGNITITAQGGAQ